MASGRRPAFNNALPNSLWGIGHSGASRNAAWNCAADYTANVKAQKNYATFTQTLGNSVTDLQTTSFHAYAQDTWKVLPGLTINGGVRYEKDRLPQPTQPNPANYQ